MSIMSTVLYRKYRAQIFDEIVGQEHITKILKNFKIDVARYFGSFGGANQSHHQHQLGSQFG